MSRMHLHFQTPLVLTEAKVRVLFTIRSASSNLSPRNSVCPPGARELSTFGHPVRSRTLARCLRGDSQLRGRAFWVRTFKQRLNEKAACLMTLCQEDNKVQWTQARPASEQRPNIPNSEVAHEEMSKTFPAVERRSSRVRIAFLEMRQMRFKTDSRPPTGAQGNPKTASEKRRRKMKQCGSKIQPEGVFVQAAENRGVRDEKESHQQRIGDEAGVVRFGFPCCPAH